MCALVMAALVINLTRSIFVALHLRSGGLCGSGNCPRSHRSSLDGMDAIIGRSRQCRHYYQDFRAPRWRVQTGPKGSRGPGGGIVVPPLVKSTRSRWSEGVLAAQGPGLRMKMKLQVKGQLSEPCTWCPSLMAASLGDTRPPRRPSRRARGLCSNTCVTRCFCGRSPASEES